MYGGFGALISIVVEPGAVGEEGDMLWKVERHGNYDHAEEEKEE